METQPKVSVTDFYTNFAHKKAYRNLKNIPIVNRWVSMIPDDALAARAASPSAGKILILIIERGNG